MKDNKIFSFVFEYEKKVFIILFTVFLVGFIWGCYSLFNKIGLTDNIDLIFQQPVLLFKKFISGSFGLFFITFLSGYNVIGFPIMFLLILYNGINLGVTISSFIYFNGFKASFLFSAIILPFIIIAVLSHYFITFSSLRLSASLYNIFKEGTRYISPKVYSRPHIIKFIFYFFITVIFMAFCSFILMPFLLKIL